MLQIRFYSNLPAKLSIACLMFFLLDFFLNIFKIFGQNLPVKFEEKTDLIGNFVYMFTEILEITSKLKWIEQNQRDK